MRRPSSATAAVKRKPSEVAFEAGAGVRDEVGDAAVAAVDAGADGDAEGERGGGGGLELVEDVEGLAGREVAGAAAAEPGAAVGVAGGAIAGELGGRDDVVGVADEVVAGDGGGVEDGLELDVAGDDWAALPEGEVGEGAARLGGGVEVVELAVVVGGEVAEALVVEVAGADADDGDAEVGVREAGARAGSRGPGRRHPRG
jgi:hypothetical protein